MTTIDTGAGEARDKMTASRASFFMERFLKEEKLLGPNEQAALHFVIDLLATPQAAPTSSQAVAGALFDFLGYLTSSDERWTFSSRDDASPAVRALQQWAEKRGLSLDDADVPNWSKVLSAPAQPVEQVPSDADYAFDDLNLRLIEVTEERDHLRAALATQPTASNAGEREAFSRMIADFPALSIFHTKHALGPMTAPSCLCCGQLPESIAIKHAELPGIVICTKCRDAALASKPPAGEQVPAEVLAAIKRAGFTLVKTAHAYHLMKFGDAVAQSTAQPPAGEQKPVGYMNAGHVHELQKKRIPYGYVYPDEATGAHVAVYTAPSAQPVDEREALRGFRRRALEDTAQELAKWEGEHMQHAARFIRAALAQREGGV